MQFERFDLLARVIEGHRRARYDLSSSDMPAQYLSEYGGLDDQSLAENHPGGGEPLRTELARLYGGHADDYIVTAGASEANFAVCAALVGPGDRVLVERPTYQPLETIPRGLGAAVVPFLRREADQFRVTSDAVRAAMPADLRLLILTNLNNPTGVPLEPSEIRGLADLAAERGFYVLVDEIFRELAVDLNVPSIGGLNEHTIVTSSVSKFYGAGGLKIGWIRAAEPARKRIRSVLDYLSGTPAGPSEAIALSLLRNRAKTVARNRRLIQEGRKVAHDWAAAERDLLWQEPVAHLAFPGLGVDTLRLADVLLRNHETFIAPGESFGLGGHVRLNIGIGADILEAGLARLSKARSTLRGR
jgi:aspartate/methionine/tyrosine aminotransferase